MHLRARARSTAAAVATGVALAVLGGVVPAGPATAQTPGAAACAVTWGSLPKTGGTPSSDPVTNVRGGRHDCYDRLVVDLAGPRTGFDVRYVSAVHEGGSGAVVPLKGGAFLQVVVRNPAYDADGDPTYLPARPRQLVDVAGWRTFRQVAWAGTFEGESTIGLGVRARLPFRAFVLDGPGGGARLVVDVAHRW